MKNQKGFIHIILILVILAVAIGGAYYFGVYKKNQNEVSGPIGKYIITTNSPTLTTSQASTIELTNWKTYTNMSHKYSFSYPDSYYLANDVDGFDGIVPPEAENISLGELINSKYIYENRLLSLSYLGFLTDIAPVNQWQKTSVIIAGIKSSKFTKIDKSVNFDYYHIPTTGTEGIELMVNNKQQVKVDQILSTFKFLDSVSDKPTITLPVYNSIVSSPFTISGTVPTGWMFEGSFPIKILDPNRNVIAQSVAKETVPGSWTSGKSVDFAASIKFQTNSKSGFLVLMADNPSGKPELDNTFEIPIKF